MYGGILSIDYSKNDSGLLLSFPGRHQLFVIDPYTVEGKITHFAGSEDPDFSFYFILRFEYPLTIDELAVSNKNSDSILNRQKNKLSDLGHLLSARNKQLITWN